MSGYIVILYQLLGLAKASAKILEQAGGAMACTMESPERRFLGVFPQYLQVMSCDPWSVKSNQYGSESPYSPAVAVAQKQ
jgi:hypothetical protein